MSAKPPKPRLNRQILDEASDWFVDFRVGDVDSSARERFDLWLRQSPEHVRAYMEIANTYVALPALDPSRKINVHELVAYARANGNLTSFAHTSRGETMARPNQPLSRAADLDGDPRLEGGAPNARVPTRHRPDRFFALVASIAMVCAAASVLAWFAFQWQSTYVTQIGERRSITLSDGSTIDLNARSKVQIKFSESERYVELAYGQALFAVAKDKTRPFIVGAGNTRVRAVGTLFDVYRKQGGTTVTVVEGRVAVLGPAQTVKPESSPPGNKAADSSSPAPVLVSAGEQVIVTERPLISPKQANVAAATAWTQHELVFDGSRLSDVVDEFNRYNTRQLVIDNRALDDFHVSGVYSSTDPASLLRFLRQQTGINVVETDESVRITRK